MPYKNITLTPNNFYTQSAVQQSQFYKGFSSVYSDSYSNKVYDYDLIKQDLLNQLHTRLGERVMNPEYGTIVWDLIFDPFTDAVKQAIADDITRILNSDPRAVPTNILITEAETGMIIDATLLYIQTNQSEQMMIDFNKETGLVSMQ